MELPHQHQLRQPHQNRLLRRRRPAQRLFKPDPPHALARISDAENPPPSLLLLTRRQSLNQLTSDSIFFLRLLNAREPPQRFDGVKAEVKIDIVLLWIFLPYVIFLAHRFQRDKDIGD